MNSSVGFDAKKCKGGEGNSPTWHRAIQRYYEELQKGGVKAPSVDKELWEITSPEQLIQQVQLMAPHDSPKSVAWASGLKRLEPILLSLNDFAAITAWSLGLSGHVSAIIWGSMRLMLKFAQPVLPELLDMLEELQRSLPRFRAYERDLVMTDALEKALSEEYTQILVFCAHSIAFFRNNPNLSKSRAVWSQFSANFRKEIANLRSCSRVVDETADMIRLSRESKMTETVSALEDMHLMPKQVDGRLPCHLVPFGLNARFLGRSAEVKDLKELLDPCDGASEMRVVSICGLGGVGKTQLALHYANVSREVFEVIAWIPAESQIKITQATTSLAAQLGIPESKEKQDDVRAVQRLKEWLNNFKKSFLLVFDNVEDANVLNQIWPASCRGSVVLTTRSPRVASQRSKEVINLGCFESEVGIEVLYKLSGAFPTTDSEISAAKEVVELLGGLPLAMVHISEFIRERGYSYEEFLKTYKKSAKKIYGRSQVPMEYDHTLNTVWDLTFENLSSSARSLLNLLTFFDPDTIHERLLMNEKADISDSRLECLSDEFDFGDTVIELGRSSLVNRLSTQKALSIHRLVQFALLSRLSDEDRVAYLDSAIHLLGSSFPNTWKEIGASQGHSWQSWETCSTVLPHVSRLMTIVNEYHLQALDQEAFAELVLRAGTYLWEKEQPTQAKKLIEYGLGLNIDLHGSNAGQAYRLLGHVALDTAQPRVALQAYQKALKIQEKLFGLDSLPVAAVLDSVACSYTEMGEVKLTFETLRRATAIHVAHDPNQMARTKAILALTYLRANEPNESLRALQQCWAMQGKTQAEIEESKYPKHSGDIMLLARIMDALGERDTARKLASRTITIRKGLFGDKGPRVADSMFTVARMLEADGEDVLAAKVLTEIIEMSKGMPEMKGHLARACWFMGNLERRLDQPEEADGFQRMAKSEKLAIEEKEDLGGETDESYMSLVEWMLW